jgi:hypothetical protein
MKTQLSTVLLVGLLCIGALTTAVLSVVYIKSMRELNDLQTAAARINQYRNAMQSLAAEAIDYSRKNPAIEPILNDIGIRTRPSTNAQPK